MTNPDQPPSDPDPSDFPPEDVLGTNAWPLPWMGPFLSALAEIPNISAACRKVGIARNTYRNHAETNDDFREAVAVAKDVGLDLLEQIAHRRATQGETRLQTRVATRERVDHEGKLVESETTTTTVEETEISNALLMRMLEAHRPERWSRQTRGWPGESVASGPVVVVVERLPTRERMLELARLAAELEPGVIDVAVTEDTNGA